MVNCDDMKSFFLAYSQVVADRLCFSIRRFIDDIERLALWYTFLYRLASAELFLGASRVEDRPFGFLVLDRFSVRADIGFLLVVGLTKETRRACPKAAEGVHRRAAALEYTCCILAIYIEPLVRPAQGTPQ